jgi:hypothetical protein
MFGLMGTAFSAINAVQFNDLQKQSDIASDKLATLKHISQIQEKHLEHLGKKLTQNELLRGETMNRIYVVIKTCASAKGLILCF